jgi:hypothetical protein
MKRIAGCTFQPKLKAGMTLAESYAAIDAGWSAFERCLKARFGR